MASIREYQREVQSENNVPAANAEDDVIITPHVDANVVEIDSASSDSSSSTRRSGANPSNVELDDSIMIIGDPAQLGSIKPIGRNEDEEDVIFVTETRQPYHVLGTIDLCDSPRPAEPPAKAPAATADNNEPSPQKSTLGKTKCPICLEMYTIDQILSTMCGHLYCAPCIQNVVKTRKKCPMCNRALKTSQLHRIYIDPNL